MQQMIEPVSLPVHAAYLDALEELTLELKRASIAVTTGALSDFEHSLVRQRISCTRLTELALQHSATAADPTFVLSAFADPMLADRMKAAIAALGTGLRCYALLLKHFGETARIFAGVFRIYGGSAGGGLGLHTIPGSWSCEL